MSTFAVLPRHWFVAVGLGAVAVYVGWFNYLVNTSSYDVWGALIIGPVLVLISIPILATVARRLDDPWFFKVALTALIVKLGASLARHWTAFTFYDGVADAGQYHESGAAFADQFRHLLFTTEVFGPDADRRFLGTGFIIFLTALIYAVTGPSLVGAYLVFSWIGFWGLFLLVIAFRTGIRTGHFRRYALMVFFLPSLLFWPSGLGKEAVMLFGVGLTLFGVARITARLRGGITFMLLGMAATTLVRPHITLLLAFALIIMFAIQPSRRVTSLTPIVRAGGLILVTLLAFVVLRQTAEFLGLEDLSQESLQLALDDTYRNTEQGGSQTTGSAVSSPLDLPWATVTVLLRPFPWEVSSAQMLLASVEGLLLLALTWRYRRSLTQTLVLLRSFPYVSFCLAYLLGFIAVFAGIANFGILVRQRSLALPCFLVLLALPVLQRRRTRGQEIAVPRPAPAEVSA